MSISLLFLCAQAAQCAPSGLNIVPTADILEPGVVSLETESIGAKTPWDSDAAVLFLLQIGLGNGWEAGLDHLLDGPHTRLNAKYRLCDETEGRPALALGLEAIGAEGGVQAYLTGTKTFGATRIHLGAFGVGGRNRAMLGLDRPLGRDVTFQADYVSGASNALTYGLAINLNDTVAITLARANANSAEVEDAYIVNLAWASRW
ncbi:MAG: hypothetical protein ACYC63_11470 [Armatimonadota bacterium]